MRIGAAHAYTADQAWDAIDITTIDNATVRLHWTDQPYTWHIERLTPGRICSAEPGDEHVAHPAPQARILVIERNGSI